MFEEIRVVGFGRFCLIIWVWGVGGRGVQQMVFLSSGKLYV